LTTHLLMLEEEERARGLSAEQARHRARMRFGRFRLVLQVVASSCSLVSGTPRFSVALGRSWTEVGLKFHRPRVASGATHLGFLGDLIPQSSIRSLSSCTPRNRNVLPRDRHSRRSGGANCF
jgi:hypothetical protein